MMQRILSVACSSNSLLLKLLYEFLTCTPSLKRFRRIAFFALRLVAFSQTLVQNLHLIRLLPQGYCLSRSYKKGGQSLKQPTSRGNVKLRIKKAAPKPCLVCSQSKLLVMVITGLLFGSTGGIIQRCTALAACMPVRYAGCEHPGIKIRINVR